MDPGYERIAKIQSLGLDLARYYKDYGHKTWSRVANCNSGITLRGGCWSPAGRPCRDRFCPRCSYAAMLRYVGCLQAYKEAGLYFVTYTWRQGLERELIVENINERNRLVGYFSGKDIVWKSEFTVRDNGLLHHHVHSIQMDLSRVCGFNAPWQHVDVQEFDGNFREILKYLAKPGTFNMLPAVSMGLFHQRVRMRGKRGFPLEPKDWLEWPLIVQGRDRFEPEVIVKSNGAVVWRDDADVRTEAAVDGEEDWVESFFGRPVSES